MHTARLRDGQAVVVKVLRPNVAALIARDVEVLYAIARLAEAYWPEARRLHPREIVAEFEKTLGNELDLMREAANAAQLERNFAGSDLLYVPKVYWDYCRPNVLTLERIFGVQVDDLAALRAAGTDIRRLAENGVEIFFTQVFRHNFFHADMHPGNIFVDVTDPLAPKYVAVDFGIVGTLDERDQHYLAENFLAFFRRDYRRVAALHIDSGWVPPGTRLDELEAAVRSVCEPIFNKPLKDISFGHRAAASLPDRAPVQHGGAAAARAAPEDAARDRGARPPALPRARSVDDREARARAVDARAPRPAHAAQAADRGVARDQRGPEPMLPRLLHRAIRRAEAREADERRAGANPPARGAPHAPVSARGRRLERTIAGASLLLAGVIWSGLSEPRWIGWVGAAAGLLLLALARRD